MVDLRRGGKGERRWLRRRERPRTRGIGAGAGIFGPFAVRPGARRGGVEPRVRWAPRSRSEAQEHTEIERIEGLTVESGGGEILEEMRLGARLVDAVDDRSVALDRGGTMRMLRSVTPTRSIAVGSVPAR